MVIVAITVFVFTAIVHIAFALAVLQDGNKLGRTVLVESWVWAIATLLGGLIKRRGVLDAPPLDPVPRAAE